MGKNNRHQKNIKSEKAKVKLKTKKTSKPLPKGLNVTDTTFKVKKIVIREQLKQHEETEILSRRKLNVKDLLSRLHHHNSTVRQEAVRELKEILSQHSTEILSSQLRSLLQGIAALTLDREREIRRDALKVLSSILGPISNEQLRPFSDVLVSYLRCAMTHIDPNIKEDSLQFLDVLAQNCSTLLAKNARKVLPNFLDMISKLRSESQPGRQLVTALNSKNTSVKWRTKVLGRLSSILSSIVSERKSQKKDDKYLADGEIIITEDIRNIPVYKKNNLNLCRINFEIIDEITGNGVELSTDLDELTKYAKVLMPLMIDCWLEVSLKQNTTTIVFDRTISLEASNLLKNIAEVIQLVIEYFELLGNENNTEDAGLWLRDNFLESFRKKILDKFPYSQTRNVQKPRKRQEDFERIDLNDKCLEENFSLCYSYIWIITANRNNKIDDETNRELCTQILDYVNERLINFTNSDNSALPNLIKLLRVIFLRGSKIFYRSGLNLGETLSSVIEAHARGPRRELQSNLFAILSEIVLNYDLQELHDEKVFKIYVTSLPGLLLKNSIYENTIEMLNRVVLQYGSWIRDELAAKHEAIIENAGKIDIIGSADEKRSRLTICNLLYFVDEQIYY